MVKKMIVTEKIDELLAIENEYDRAYKLIEILFKDIKDKEGDSYLGHLIRVSHSLKEPNTKVAGLLHDVVEDIENITFEDLEYLGFNQSIIELVKLVTKDYDSTGMSKEEKKNAYHKKITSILESNNIEAVKLKYADMSDNLKKERLDKLDEQTKEHLYNKYKDEVTRLKSYLIERNCLYE